jgi:predicted transcriptional regulator
MHGRALLVSVRPRFAAMIFGGSKTVELRRVKPAVGRGDLLILYVSSPTKALGGVAEIADLIHGNPGAVWSRVGGQTGMSREDFDGYFRGASRAYAIVLARVWKIESPVGLAEIQEIRSRFRPPQSYLYVDAQDVLHPRATHTVLRSEKLLSIRRVSRRPPKGAPSRLSSSARR